MSLLADDFSTGVMPAQNYDPAWTFDTLQVGRRVRVIGKNPATKLWVIADGTNGTAETLGFEAGLAVFAPAHAPDPDQNTRNVALWGSAWAGFVGHPSGNAANGSTSPSPADPNLSSPFSVFPSHSQADDGGWQDDTGLRPQLGVSFDGQDLPGGTPGAIVPLTGATSQQLAFVPAGNFLTCDWAGGARVAKMSSRVWDVTSSGERDVNRHAPVHSFWRIFRRPVSGSISFGSAASSGGTQSASKAKRGGKPAANLFPGDASHESALAWVLSPGVDGNAGRGIVSDLGATGAPPPPPPPPRTATTSGLPTGKTQQAPATNALGTYVSSLTLATTLAGLQDQLSKNASQLAAAQGMGAAGAAAIGQLNDQKNQIIQAMARLMAAPPTTTSKSGGSGVTKPVLASLCKAAFGIIDVGDAGNDPHLLATTPDGESINQSHLNILAALKGDGFDCPMASDGAWQPITGGGPLLAPTYFRADLSRTHPTAAGVAPGLRSWQTPVPMDAPPYVPYTPGNPGDPVTSKTPTGGGVIGTPTTDATPAGPSVGTPQTVAIPAGPLVGTPQTGAIPAAVDTSGTDLLPLPGPSVGTPQTGAIPAGPSIGTPTTGATPAGPSVGTPQTGGTDLPPLPGPHWEPDPSAPGGERLIPGYLPTDPEVIRKYYPSTGGPKPGDKAYLGPAGGATASNASIASLGSRATLDRSYMRMPNELALPALLARPQPLVATGAPDLRALTDVYLGNVPGGFDAYNAPPIAATFAAFADQSGGVNGFNLNGTRRSSRYRGGVAAAGGFALLPPNVDIEDVVLGNHLPSSLPTVSILAATTAAQIGWADPLRNGIASNGFVGMRDFGAAGGGKRWNLHDVNAAGVLLNTPALQVDSVNQTLSIYGHTPFQTGGTAPLNTTAGVDPTVSADSSAGYSTFSRWYNNVKACFFECRDATVGAAIWTPVAAPNLTAIAASWVTGTHDSAVSYSTHDLRVDGEFVISGEHVAGFSPNEAFLE